MILLSLLSRLRESRNVRVAVVGRFDCGDFFGYKVNADFEWIGSWISIVSLATATIIEVAVYYLPCVDNLLDLVNVPLAFAAGAVVMSGVLPDVHPYFKWSIAGRLDSSAAGLTQLVTTIIRGASTATHCASAAGGGYRHPRFPESR